MKKGEKYILISHSGEEIISHPLQGPVQCSLAPEVIGQFKGVATAELQLEDGTRYKMNLPWGCELFEYKLGRK